MTTLFVENCYKNEENTPVEIAFCNYVHVVLYYSSCSYRLSDTTKGISSRRIRRLTWLFHMGKSNNLFPFQQNPVIRATPTPFGAKIATSVENRQKYNFKKSLHFAKLYIFKFKILFFILCGSKRAFLFLIFCRTIWIKVITDTKLQIYNSSCSLLICPAENRISIRYATLLNEKKHSII